MKEDLPKREEASFKSLCDIITRLRSPEGCLWDREQSPMSLRGALVEETYECIEAISEKDPVHIKEELGDLFLLATMLSYMHQQEGTFSIADVLDGISEKLIRRHPHVFSDVQVKDTMEVLDNWARIKAEEKGSKPKQSHLDSVKSGLPPLERAFELQKKAAKAGFDWPDINGVLAKIEEELEEFREAVNKKDQEKEEELGDLLFSIINLCRFQNIDPMSALLKTNSKFIRRFHHVETRMKEAGAEMKQENLDQMETYWQEAKNKKEESKSETVTP